MFSIFKNKNWCKAAGVRALKTMAQSVIAVIGVGGAFNELDWKLAIGTAVTSGILSICTSITGLPEVEEE